MRNSALPSQPFGAAASAPSRQPLRVLNDFAVLRDEHRRILIRERQEIAQGRLAIWNGLMWDNSLMYACDAVPLSIIELWRDGVPESHAVAEGLFQIPEEFCSSGKSILGRLHLLRDVTSRRVIVFAAGCDPRSITYELLKTDGFDVFTIDNVTAFRSDPDRYEAYVAYLAEEFEGFAPWLIGAPIDQDRLREEIRFKNKVLALIQRILHLRQRSPLLISYIELQSIIMGGTHFYGQRDRYLQLLEKTLLELEELVVSTHPARHVPIIVSGIASLAVIRAIEESGGAVVGTVRFGSEQYREDVPPLESIARYLLDIQLKGEGHDISGAPASHPSLRATKHRCCCHQPPGRRGRARYCHLGEAKSWFSLRLYSPGTFPGSGCRVHEDHEGGRPQDGRRR